MPACGKTSGVHLCADSYRFIHQTTNVCRVQIVTSVGNVASAERAKCRGSTHTHTQTHSKFNILHDIFKIHP